MKKYLLTIILFILIIPTVVLASTCNPDDIVIETVTLSKKVGNATEVTAASIDNKTLDLDVKLNDPNDYMEYTITVKNNGTEDYYIKEDDFANNQYLKYEFIYEDSSYKIEPNEEKEITLRVSYVNRIEGNANYTETNNLKLNILDKQDIKVANTLMNLSIGIKIIIGLIIIAIIIGVVILFKNNKKSRKMIVLLIGLAMFIPLYCHASCNSKIDVDVKVELDNKQSTFAAGALVNKKMKNLAGTDTTEDGEFTYDSNIIAFKKSSTEPIAANKTDNNLVSAENSDYPIYVWFDNGTIWWWSEDETPSVGVDGSFFFAALTALTNIEGVATFDLSNTTTLLCVFAASQQLLDLSPITYWNILNVTSLEQSFVMTSIIDYSPISNWNTSNVVNLDGAFGLTPKTSFEEIANWDVSNVVSMMTTFAYSALTDLDDLANWDVSKVENLSYTFCFMSSLTDIEGIRNWDVSNVKNYGYIFSNDTSLSNREPIEKWTTSSLETLHAAFQGMTSLTSIDLSSWDVSHANCIEFVFAECSNLIEVNISGWDTSNVHYMNGTFHNCSKLTTITGIEYIDTSNIEEMGSLFANCKKITSLDLHRWNVSNAVYMSSVFADCYSLTSINLVGWVTSKAEDMSYMFNTIPATVLDLSTFDTRNVTTFKRMFNNSASIETVYIGENWNTSANTDESIYIFHTTTHLPNFNPDDPTCRQLSWARPTTEGGYFTLKTNA